MGVDRGTSGDAVQRSCPRLHEEGSCAGRTDAPELERTPAHSVCIAAASGEPMVKLDLPNISKIVLVTSGKGGVGKSTVVSNLAAEMAKRGLRIGLLDADFHGPSISVMFGSTERPRVVDRKIIPIVRYGIKLLSAGMLGDPAKAFVWRGALLRGVLKQLLRDTNWGDLDVLFIDMPPGTGEVHIAVLDLVEVDSAVVVTTPQEVARSDVRRSLTMLSSTGVPIVGLVENMGVFTCTTCGTAHQLFPGANVAAIAEEFGIPLTVRLPFHQAIGLSGDAGAPLLTTSGQIEEELASCLAPVIAAI